MPAAPAFGLAIFGMRVPSAQAPWVMKKGLFVLDFFGGPHPTPARYLMWAWLGQNMASASVWGLRQPRMLRGEEEILPVSLQDGCLRCYRSCPPSPQAWFALG